MTGVAELFYTVFSTTTLSMIADVLPFYIIKSNLSQYGYMLSFVASAAIDLLKQLKEKDEMSTYMVVDQVFFY